jgi:adenylate cyclase class IV
VGRNLEIKVRCGEDEFASVKNRVLAAGARVQSMHQIDTYFVVMRGRMKLREIETGEGIHSTELISYQRPDRTGSRWSDYRHIPLSIHIASDLKSALETACGVAAVVDKWREVAILRRTRVHLDRVATLGCFVELETVAREDDDDADLAAEHEELIGLLGLSTLEVVAGSYNDLMGTEKGPGI